MGDEAVRVSVVVPSRDRAGSLARTLDGLARQTHRDFETIVVDDGSTDDTVDVVKRAAEDGLDVVYVRTEGIGAVGARLTGVAHARGEVLAFTDSDCVPEPDWLERLGGAIADGADVAQGRTIPERAVGPLERSVAHSGGDGIFATCNVAYRRSAYEAAGGFDGAAGERLGFRPDARSRGLGFGEDALLGWRVARAGTPADAPDAVVRHEVIRPPVAELFSRAWMAGAFPSLVVEVPELAERLLSYGVVLGRPGLRHLAALAVLLLVLAPPLGGLAAVGWLLVRARTLGGGLRDAAALPIEFALDVTTVAALVVGSVRARRMVL